MFRKLWGSFGQLSELAVPPSQIAMSFFRRRLRFDGALEMCVPALHDLSPQAAICSLSPRERCVPRTQQQGVSRVSTSVLHAKCFGCGKGGTTSHALCSGLWFIMVFPYDATIMAGDAVKQHEPGWLGVEPSNLVVLAINFQSPKKCQ